MCNYIFTITNQQLQIYNYKSEITNLQLQMCNYIFTITNLKFQICKSYKCTNKDGQLKRQ